MNDLIRKGFLLGVGAAVTSKEKFDQKLREMVEQNELTQEEAKSVMQNFMDKGEMKKDEWNTRQYEQAQKFAKDIGLATKEDINELRARITQLEAMLDQNEQ